MSEKIFNIIKGDCVKEFATLVDEKKGTLSLRLGRFPVLSLCYLYNSRKIISAYGEQMRAIKSYHIEDEPVEAYKKFKAAAKKSLRLYTKENAIVTPLEMLAVLGSYSIKKEYPAQIKNAQNASVKENITKIYALSHSMRIAATADDIKVYRLPLTARFSFYLKLIFVFFAVMVFLAAGLMMTANSLIGYGNKDSYGKIYSSANFLGAIKNNASHIRLMNDIELSPTEAYSYGGTIDGGGKTLYLKAGSTPLIDEFSGLISNLNIVWTSETNLTITESTSFFIQTNKGTIEDITLSASGSLSVRPSDTTEELYLSILVNTNSGEIKSSTATATLTMDGDSTNAYFAVFAAENNGLISECTLSSPPDSAISTDTVDIGGIVAINNSGAVIDKCVNNSDITQVTAKNNWNPNCGGIAMINLGNITNSVNNGNITAATTVLTSGGGAFSAGIATINEGLIQFCKNYGTITGNAQTAPVYCGGISAQNYNTLSKCIAFGDVKVESDVDTNFLFGGGITGYSGYMLNTCLSAAVVSSKNVDRVYLGGIAGVALNQTFSIDCFYINMDCSIKAAMYYTAEGNVIQPINYPDTMLGSMDELTAKITWE